MIFRFLLHSNILGSKWFVSFIDDGTQISKFSLLKQKLGVSTIVPNLKCSQPNLELELISLHVRI